MSRDRAVRSRKRSIVKRAQFEKESEAAFYARVEVPVLCYHVRHTRVWVNGHTVAFMCYNCGLGIDDERR